MSLKRAVVDTNVVVSALVAGGTPQKIIQAWITGQFLAIMSEDKGLLKHKKVSGIEMMTPDQFCKKLKIKQVKSV